MPTTGIIGQVDSGTSQAFVYPSVEKCMRARGPYVDTPPSTDMPAPASVVRALQSHQGTVSSPGRATCPFMVSIWDVSQSATPFTVRPRTQRATS